MTATLNATFGPTGQGQYNANVPVGVTLSKISVGSGGFVADAVHLAYGSGTTTTAGGALQCDDWFLGALTMAPSGTATIDLNGAGNQNPFGVNLAFTAVKFIMVALVNPNGIDFVNIGPQGNANTAQLWFGGTGATAYETFAYWLLKPGPAAGWTVTASTAHLLPFANPSADTVTVNVFIAGVK